MCTRASFDAACALLRAVSKWPGGNSADEVDNGAWRSLDSSSGGTDERMSVSRESLRDWIEDWLSDRKQRVVINGTSGWREVTSGVPQGSVLGPLLFIIYINDLDLGLVSKISKFADGTKMGINADSDAAVKQLQEDLRKVGEWSKKWQMPFNLDKCKIMHIGHKNKSEKYELLGKERKRDEAGRYSVGGREYGLRGAVIPPLSLHLQREEGVRCLLLNELIECRVYIPDESLEELGGRQMPRRRGLRLQAVPQRDCGSAP